MAQLDYKFSVIAEPAKRVRAYFLDADGSPSSNEQLRLGLEARDLVLQLHDERGKQASYEMPSLGGWKEPLNVVLIGGGCCMAAWCEWPHDAKHRMVFCIA